jgi:AsmA protein
VITAIGIRRLGLAVVACAVIGIGALVILPFLMPADAVREAVKAEIRAVTGLDPVLRGATSVSLFPTGNVSFNDVSLGDNRTGAPALTAERVVARLRFFPFLTGRIEIADVSLVRPTIAVIFNADRSSNWSGHIETLARNLKPAPGRAASFSEIRIEDGTVILRDEAYRIVESISNVEFALAWPSISQSFAATGRFAWHDEPIDASFSFTDFVAARRSRWKARWPPTQARCATRCAGRASSRRRAAGSGVSRSRPRPMWSAARLGFPASTSSSTATAAKACLPLPTTGGGPCKARWPPRASTSRPMSPRFAC